MCYKIRAGRFRDVTGVDLERSLLLLQLSAQNGDYGAQAHSHHPL